MTHTQISVSLTQADISALEALPYTYETMRMDDGTTTYLGLDHRVHDARLTISRMDDGSYRLVDGCEDTLATGQSVAEVCSQLSGLLRETV
jgi:hypothetical protein